MKLWGGRFTKETNELVNHFNASLPFDCRFYAQDIRGSIAHVTMLAKLCPSFRIWKWWRYP